MTPQRTPRHQRIEKILNEALKPEVLEIENESHSHSGNRLESHFKVLAVSGAFDGLSRIDRQRKVNELLKTELETGLHALTQRLLTPVEWQKQQETLRFESPACSGGSKRM